MAYTRCLSTIGSRFLDLSSFSDGGGEVLEDVDGGVPADAGVCDADASLEARGALGWDLLCALVQVGFDHDADDAVFAGAELVGDDLCNLGLVAVVLERVACRVVLVTWESGRC